MSRPSRPWFRFYTEAPTDPKVRRLSVESRWLFVAVLGLARMSPLPGTLMLTETVPAGVDDLADYANLPAKKVQTALKELVDLGLVQSNPFGCWFVPNWDKRQFESDDVTKRTRQHRHGEDE